MPYGAPQSGAGQTFNAVINGDVSVDQLTPNNTTPNAAVQITAGGTPVFDGPDCYALAYDSNATFNVTYDRALSHPVLGVQGWSLYYLNAGAGIAAANRWLSLVQYLEGLNIAPLVYGPAFLSFQVMSPFTGDHYVALFTGASGIGGPASGASYVARYTVPTANAWTFVSIPMDFTNTAAFGNAALGKFGPARQATLHFPLQVGANFQTATLNAWNASPSNALAGVNPPNFANMLTPFRLTDIALTPASVIGHYPRLLAQTNLLQCQRYLWYSRIASGGSFTSVPLQYYARIAGVHNDGINVGFPAPMRDTPTVTAQNTANPAITNWRNATIGANSGAAAIESLSSNYCFIRNPQVAGDNAGDLLQLNAVFNARLA